MSTAPSAATTGTSRAAKARRERLDGTAVTGLGIRADASAEHGHRDAPASCLRPGRPPRRRGSSGPEGPPASARWSARSLSIAATRR
jgi:hypothetical protein